jgi:flagellin FlaB
VVAAVFAYTVLSAGLFSTQKGQEAVYSGLKEAQSTLELKGSVIATANTTGAAGKVQQISFIVSNVLGGEAVDFTEPSENTSSTGTAASGSSNKVVINYIDQNQNVKNLYWTVTKMGNDDGDNLLEVNEKFQITIGGDTVGSGAGNLVDALSVSPLTVNKTFDLEVVTPAGAVLTVERTIPAYIDTIMNLH